LHVIPGDTVVFQHEPPRELYFVYIGALHLVPYSTFLVSVLKSFLSDLFVSFWSNILHCCSLNLAGGWGWSYRFCDPLRRAQSGKSTRALSLHAGLNVHVVAAEWIQKCWWASPNRHPWLVKYLFSSESTT
jgi:hypothetical protein